MAKKINELPEWPDARGWIGIGAFVLTVMVLWMVKEDTALRGDEFFKVLATLIVGGFVKDVLGWAYTATKGGGELADANAKIVADVADASAARALKDGDKPQDVKIVGQKKPVAVTETDTPTQDDEEDAAPRPRGHT
jgi:hypothetical protein